MLKTNIIRCNSNGYVCQVNLISMKANHILMIPLVTLFLGCSQMACPELSGTYMRDPHNIIQLTSDAGQLIASYKGIDHECHCSQSGIKFSTGDKDMEVTAVREGVISVDGWEYSCQLPTCLDLMGKYRCTEGQECSVNWSTGSYYLDYFGYVFQCDCDDGKLIIDGDNAYAGTAIASVEDKSIVFNGHRYYRHLVPQQ